MRHLLAKLALSSALLAGGAMVAQACPNKTVTKDTAAGSFQLAQSSGGGSSSGSAGSSGTAGQSTTPGTSGSGGGAAGRGPVPVIPQDTPMRQPPTPTDPAAPTQPSTGTTTTTPSR